MSARKPDPANGLGAAVGTDEADVLELGVTVALGAPHALSRVTMDAVAARARAQAEGKSTSPRIAEPSRLSSYRCEENPTHGTALRSSRHAPGGGTRRPACRAHRP